MTVRMIAVLSHHRFDVDQYQRMARTGILSEDDRVELLDGEIVQMHAVGSRHFACVNRLTRLLSLALKDHAIVSVQGPVRLGRYSEPEPDIALLRPRADFYADELPGPQNTLLIIEVADSSLALDRSIKLPLYAAAEVPEVWLIDLESQALEAHTRPRAGRFTKCRRITHDTVAAIAFPDLELDIREILPDARQ